MKKTVLAFAVAAAMGVPAVAAADTTLYGRFHVSLDNVDTGAVSGRDMNNRGSRIGVRGSEDLGGGLSGIYQAEFQMNATTGVQATGGDGNGAFTGRDAFVGVAGDFGQVRLGVITTPYEVATGGVQAFGDTVLDVRTFLGVAPSTSVLGRQGNSIAYTSPNFSGLRLMGQYSVGTSGDSNKNDVVSVGAMYTQGPLHVFGAYEQRNTTTSAEQKGMMIGGRYTIDDLRIGVAYDRVENETNSRNAYVLTARYNIGQAYLMGIYGNAGDFGADNTGAKGYGVGAGYSFSRRTDVYAAYMKIDNDSSGLYGSRGEVPTPSSAGQDPSSFSIGIQHNF